MVPPSSCYNYRDPFLVITAATILRLGLTGSRMRTARNRGMHAVGQCHRIRRSRRGDRTTNFGGSTCWITSPIGVTNVERSTAFYDQALRPLDIRRLYGEADTFAGYGSNGRPTFGSV
jgi:hypothetical protein